MKITKDMLYRWYACEDDYNWFVANFPSGEGEYQDVLNKLAEDDQPSYAFWLMKLAGDDETVLRLNSFSGKNLFLAGSLIVDRNIRIHGSLLVAENVEVSGNIDVDGNIWVREDIEVRGSIQAGGAVQSYGGIQAGGNITSWSISARGLIRSGGEIDYARYMSSIEGIKIKP